MVFKDGKTYFKLSEIADQSPYSADYLRIRILQKKLKGVKIGRDWHTTRNWLGEYVAAFSTKPFKPQSAALAEIIPEGQVAERDDRFVISLDERKRFIPYAVDGKVELVDSDLSEIIDLRKLRKGPPPLPPIPSVSYHPRREPTFRDLLSGLKSSFPRKLLAFPVIGGLVFLIAYPFLTGRLHWQDIGKTASRSFDAVGSTLIDVKVPKPEELPELAWAFASRISRGVSTVPAKFAATLKEAGYGLGELPLIAADSLDNLSSSSLLGSFRSFAFSRLPSLAKALRLSIPAREEKPLARISATKEKLPLAALVTPFPSPVPKLARIEEVSPSPAIPSQPVKGTEVVREIIRPADLSAFQKKLDDINLSLRQQVNKLISDVASLYEGPQIKTSVVQSFAPSQGINKLSKATLSDVTFSGSNQFNLTDADIPDNITCTNCGSGSGTVSTGVANAVAFYSSAGTTVDDASALFWDDTARRLGVGTSSPYAELSVAQDIVARNIVATSTAVFSGIGTSSPAALLGVGGAMLYGSAGATSTNVGNQLIVGNFEVRGTCSGCGSGGGTPGGSDTQVQFNNAGAFGGDSNFIWDNSAKRFGLGTSTPGTLLSVNGPSLFTATSTFVSGIITSNVLSTTSISFYPNSSVAPAMIVHSGGNVGIGTTTPGTLLSVHNGSTVLGGPTTIEGPLSLPYLQATSTTPSFLNYASSTSLSLSNLLNVSGAGTSTFTGGLGIGTTSPSAMLAVQQTGGDAAYFDGNVGFGTANPLDFLHLRVPNAGGGIIIVQPAASTNATARFLVDSNNRPTVGSYSNHNFYLAANSTQYWFVNTSGHFLDNNANANIGLGTSTPGARLSVNGSSLFVSTSTFLGGLLTPSISATSSIGFYTGGAAAPRVVIDSSGNVGIGTTSPGSLFSVHGPALINGTSTIIGGLLTPSISATGTLGFYTGGAAAPRAYIDSSGNVGIATTVPSALFSAAGSSFLGTGVADKLTLNLDEIYFPINATATISALSTAFAFGTTTAANVPPIMAFDGLNGRVGIGTTSPTTIFHVANIKATSTFEGGLSVAAGAFQHDWFTGLTSIDNGVFGAQYFDTDSGIVTWMDLPVATTAASVVQSYTARVDGLPLLTLWSETDGAGGLKDTLKVGIASSTPWGRLSIEIGTSTDMAFVVGDSGLVDGTTTPFFAIDSRGRTGLGTTSPWGFLAIEHLSSTTDPQDIPAFVVSDQGTSSPSLIVLNSNGWTGVATRTPSTTFAVGGRALIGSANATSTNVGNEEIVQNLAVKGNLEILGSCKGCPNAGIGVNSGTANRLTSLGQRLLALRLNFHFPRRSAYPKHQRDFKPRFLHRRSRRTQGLSNFFRQLSHRHNHTSKYF